MFRQGLDESFCETWERFKVIQIKCPNHGFEDIAQLNIFHNGLSFDTKMFLDVAACGTIMVVDVEQATNIIDALSSTHYQAYNDVQIKQKKGMLNLNTSYMILV